MAIVVRKVACLYTGVRIREDCERERALPANAPNVLDVSDRAVPDPAAVDDVFWRFIVDAYKTVPRVFNLDSSRDTPSEAPDAEEADRDRGPDSDQHRDEPSTTCRHLWDEPPEGLDPSVTCTGCNDSIPDLAATGYACVGCHVIVCAPCFHAMPEDYSDMGSP